MMLVVIHCLENVLARPYHVPFLLCVLWFSYLLKYVYVSLYFKVTKITK